MGLIQRVIEAIGIATISITLSTEISKKVRPPRALYPGFPLGHPIGFPGRTFRQFQVLRLLLKYLEKIDSPGTVINLNLTADNDPATTYIEGG